MYPLIIEPFAGAAGYSVLHRTHQVQLNDLDPVIADVWKWIINASADEIRALPDVEPGEDLDKLKLPRAQHNLMKFACARGKTRGGVKGDRENEDVRIMKQRLLEMSFSHWTISNLDYTLLPNVEATYFVDAPYLKEGAIYKHHSIDYKLLGEWCRSRRGQVIVCESEFGEWLPFRNLYRNPGRNWTLECVWTNSD